jgi:hypothetical protein
MIDNFLHWGSRPDLPERHRLPERLRREVALAGDLLLASLGPYLVMPNLASVLSRLQAELRHQWPEFETSSFPFR